MTYKEEKNQMIEIKVDSSLKGIVFHAPKINILDELDCSVKVKFFISTDPDRQYYEEIKEGDFIYHDDDSSSLSIMKKNDFETLKNYSKEQ